MEKLGFIFQELDSALLSRKLKHGYTLLLLYVDDMVTTEDDFDGIQNLKHHLSQHFDLKEVSSLRLGLKVLSDSNEY